MNQYNPNMHHRRSIRLRGYDYSQAGLYFVTICVQKKACLFGKIVVGKGAQNIDAPTKELNDAGKMVETEWLKLPDRFKNIKLHDYVVMPNHFHAILEIVGTTAGATLLVAPNKTNDHEIGQPQGFAPDNNITGKTIGDMMDAFKSITTVEYIRGVKMLGWKPFNCKMWQRNYWDHIIRNEQSYQRISDYIINNPANWKGDKFFL